MSKDPAFLFYDGDAARDVSHMNRLERGCYFDFIQAQRKFHGITAEQVRKILGKDFDNCWPALEMVLSNVGGVYFIQWLKDSIDKRAQNSEIQRKRIQDYWDRINNNGITTEVPRYNRGTSTDIPIENENENRNKKESAERKVEKHEALFEKVVAKNSINIPEGFKGLIMEWLKYKSEKGQSYKETGMKNMIISFLTESGGDLVVAGEMVKYSTSNNYSGLFKKTKTNGTNNGNIGRRIKRVNELWNR